MGAVWMWEGWGDDDEDDVWLQCVQGLVTTWCTPYILVDVHISISMHALSTRFPTHVFPYTHHTPRPSVFYVFGGAGLLWCVAWEQLVTSCAAKDPTTIAKLYGSLSDDGGAPAAVTGAAAAGKLQQQGEEAVPWRAIARSRPFWCVIGCVGV